MDEPNQKFNFKDLQLQSGNGLQCLHFSGNETRMVNDCTSNSSESKWGYKKATEQFISFHRPEFCLKSDGKSVIVGVCDSTDLTQKFKVEYFYDHERVRKAKFSNQQISSDIAPKGCLSFNGDGRLSSSCEHGAPSQLFSLTSKGLLKSKSNMCLAAVRRDSKEVKAIGCKDDSQIVVEKDGDPMIWFRVNNSLVSHLAPTMALAIDKNNIVELRQRNIKDKAQKLKFHVVSDKLTMAGVKGSISHTFDGENIELDMTSGDNEGARCLQMPSSDEIGVSITVGTCADSPNQRFSLTAENLLISEANEMCFKHGDDRVIQYDCDSSSDERLKWLFHSVDQTFRSFHQPDFCMTISRDRVVKMAECEKDNQNQVFNHFFKEKVIEAEKGMSVGVIIGVIGAGILLLGCILSYWYYRRRRMQSHDNDDDSSSMATMTTVSTTSTMSTWK